MNSKSREILNETQDIAFIIDCVNNGDNRKAKNNPYSLNRNVILKEEGKIYELLDFYVQDNKSSRGKKVGYFLAKDIKTPSGTKTKYICAFKSSLIKDDSKIKPPKYALEFPMAFPDEVSYRDELPQVVANRLERKYVDLLMLIRKAKKNEHNYEKFKIVEKDVGKSSKLPTDDVFCRISVTWKERYDEYMEKLKKLHEDQYSDGGQDAGDGDAIKIKKVKDEKQEEK